MLENFIFLVAGGVIGILSSIISIRYQHRLTVKRQHELWDHEKQKEMIEAARDLMRSRDYQTLRYGEPGEITFCHFLVEAGPDQGTDIAINKNIFVIGHSTELCDQTLSDSKAADAHLRLLIAEDVCVVENISHDLNTYIGDRLIIGPKVIKNGDRVRLGASQLRFSRHQHSQIE